MDAKYTTSRWTIALAWLVMPLLASGCASMGATGGSASLTDAPAGAAADSKFAVEFHYDGDKKKPQVVEKPIADTMHMQEALEQTGALKKFRRCTINLVRPLPGGMGHKMQIEYDRGTRRVMPEFDYAVLPGDRILITEDTTGVIGDILDSPYFSPLKQIGPNKGRTSTGGHFRMGS